MIFLFLFMYIFNGGFFLFSVGLILYMLFDKVVIYFFLIFLMFLIFEINFIVLLIKVLFGFNNNLGLFFFLKFLKYFVNIDVVVFV